MIDKFGRVMVYVKNPRSVADFFISKIGFIEQKVNMKNGAILSVEVAPNGTSDALIEFFDVNIVRSMSPELSTEMPSICFSCYDIHELRSKLIDNSVNVGEVVEIAGSVTINFFDVEGNYYSIREVTPI